MLEQVLTHIHNWFQVGIFPGEYTIQDGGITLPFLRDGQYFRIMGSVFNDGLHRYGPDMEALTDETFDGTVWALAVPKDVIDAVTEWDEWDKKYGERANSPYSSENLAGQYGYGKDTTVTDALAKTGIPPHILAKVKRHQKIREFWQ